MIKTLFLLRKLNTQEVKRGEIAFGALLCTNISIITSRKVIFSIFRFYPPEGRKIFGVFFRPKGGNFFEVKKTLPYPKSKKKTLIRTHHGNSRFACFVFICDFHNVIATMKEGSAGSYD